ncbi:prolyl-tRNA synthetase associated domain-containing protein [Litorimonas sp. RW-G-Af-16]|uniref:prolyl-tRNA synthetase associated domain-containing protein n=1 Tax=Litorimonas sp. RW-G-Af-16 TaxID=3241168 RepID=UPI00390C9BD1
MNTNTPPQSPNEAALFALLKQASITTETVEHAAVFTVEESAAIKADLPGGHTKNLFLKDKSGAYALVCAVSDTVIKVNKLHPQIGMKRLSFGKADALEDKLGVKPGSVTLFSIINDTEGEVRLILDKALFDHTKVWFHPLRNTASTAISTSDIEKFAKATGHTPTVIDFAALLED